MLSQHVRKTGNPNQIAGFTTSRRMHGIFGERERAHNDYIAAQRVDRSALSKFKVQSSFHLPSVVEDEYTQHKQPHKVSCSSSG